jgi:tagatose-1,6-bisphosphate aldolase
MAECSVCSNAEAASVVNELLEKKTALDVIAQQTGFHRSSVHRHSKKCYPAWRAARLKTKRTKTGDISGRVITSWPGTSPGERQYAYYDEVITELKETDTVFSVEYAKTRLAHVKNLRGCALTDDNFEEFLALALAEDAQRAELPAKPENAL